MGFRLAAWQHDCLRLTLLDTAYLRPLQTQQLTHSAPYQQCLDDQRVQVWVRVLKEAIPFTWLQASSALRLGSVVQRDQRDPTPRERTPLGPSRLWPN